MVIDLRVDFSNNNEADDYYVDATSPESHINIFFSPVHRVGRRHRRRRATRICVYNIIL